MRLQTGLYRTQNPDASVGIGSPQTVGWRVACLLVATLIGGTGCKGSGDPASAPGSAAEQRPNDQTAAPSTAPDAQPESPGSPSNLPGSLEILGDRDGTVYLNGTQIADNLPVLGHILAPGRYTLQLVYGDGRELSAPRAIRVSDGGRASVYVRYTGTWGLEALPAPAGHTPTEPTAPAPADGSAPPAAEIAPPPDGSGPVAPDTGIAGTPAPDPTTDPGVYEGSSLPEVTEDQAGRVVLDSEPTGAVVYLNLQRTALTTPTELLLPPGDWQVQVLLPDSRLSMPQSLAMEAGVAVALTFVGNERTVLRNR